MKPFLLVACTALALALAAGAGIAEDPAADRPLLTEATSLDPFLWTARPIVVFADSANDPRFIQQIALLEARKAELFTRDVVVIADTDPEMRSEIRTQLRPRGFSVVIIDKDGKVIRRKPAPWDVREVTRAIDKTPLRQDEIMEKLGK